MKKAGYKVTRQELPFNAFSELGPSALEQKTPNQVTYQQTTDGGTTGDFDVTPHSDPGDVTAAVTPVDIQLGIGNTSTSWL